MDYGTFWVIFTILFWVLVAIAVVCGLVWTYIQCIYYKWNRDERIQEQFTVDVNNAVKETLEELENERESNNT